jgi:hypothetical protein
VTTRRLLAQCGSSSVGNPSRVSHLSQQKLPAATICQSTLARCPHSRGRSLLNNEGESDTRDRGLSGLRGGPGGSARSLGVYHSRYDGPFRWVFTATLSPIPSRKIPGPNSESIRFWSSVENVARGIASSLFVTSPKIHACGLMRITSTPPRSAEMSVCAAPHLKEASLISYRHGWLLAGGASPAPAPHNLVLVVNQCDDAQRDQDASGPLVNGLWFAQESVRP